jgi:hypothetical protein
LRFWTEELPDAWRLARAVDVLLREREPAAPGAVARTTHRPPAEDGAAPEVGATASSVAAEQ